MATFLVEVENRPSNVRSDEPSSDVEERKPIIRQPRKSVVSREPEQRRRTISDAGRRVIEQESVRSRRSSQWIRRFSQAGSQKKSSDAPPVHRVQLENTYRLGPDEGGVLNVSEAKRVIQEVLDSYLDGEQYHVNRCRNMAKQLSDVIKSRMQMIKRSERYRIVTIVSLAENAGQGYQVASQCLWDTSTDRFASVNYSNATIVATVTVYAVYYE